MKKKMNVILLSLLFAVSAYPCSTPPSVSMKPLTYSATSVNVSWYTYSTGSSGWVKQVSPNTYLVTVYQGATIAKQTTVNAPNLSTVIGGLTPHTTYRVTVVYQNINCSASQVVESSPEQTSGNTFTTFDICSPISFTTKVGDLCSTQSAVTTITPVSGATSYTWTVSNTLSINGENGAQTLTTTNTSVAIYANNGQGEATIKVVANGYCQSNPENSYDIWLGVPPPTSIGEEEPNSIGYVFNSTQENSHIVVWCRPLDPNNPVDDKITYVWSMSQVGNDNPATYFYLYPNNNGRPEVPFTTVYAMSAIRNRIVQGNLNVQTKNKCGTSAKASHLINIFDATQYPQ